MMPPEQIIAWIVAANTAITLATSLYTFLTSRASKAMAAIEKLVETIEKDRDDQKLANEAVAARFQLVESRIQRVEATIEYLPSRDGSHQLELAVERLNGRIETLDEKLKPIDALARRLQEFLVRQVEVRADK